MTAERFNQLLEIRLRAIKESLAAKAEEYTTTDKLHNFKKAAETFKCRSSEACWNYIMKHLVSIKDAADGTKVLSPEQIHEKCGDAINYLILMEALLLEDIAASLDRPGIFGVNPSATS